MSLIQKNFFVTVAILATLVPEPLLAKKAGTNDGVSEESTRVVAHEPPDAAPDEGRNSAQLTAPGESVVRGSLILGELWNPPSDVASRNLFYGSGGADHQPGKAFTFIKEDLHGSNPKFVVKDENGVKWKVKLGDEAQPETAASRLVWAAGYYADEDYFVPVLRVSGLEGHLKRGARLVQPGGIVLNARLKREDNRKKVGTWRWRHSPFSDTREFNGLRVMMALIDNWDLKNDNNAILDENGKRIYEVSDLGASFGTNGVLIEKDKAKGNLHSFEHSKFITNETADHVSFGTPAAPSMPYLFTILDYESRVRLRWIGKDIPRADAKWIGQILGQLSPQQLSDSFRAAGYPQAKIDSFTWWMRLRIGELTAL